MSLRSALKSGDLAELPGRRDESWRWTDLRATVRTVPPVSPAADLGEQAGPFATIPGEEIAFVNGRRLDGDRPDELVQGVAVRRLRFVSHAEKTAHAAAWGADLAPGASLLLLESYEGRGADYVADATLRFSLGQGAKLERIVLMDEPQDAVSVSCAEVELAAGASFGQIVLTTGARLQRHETRVRHHGRGATVRMDGVYLLDGARHADLTTSVVHEGPGGTTSQMIKGVAADRARGVFQGRIVVEAGADQTDARMRHDALLLSDRAEIDAKPELEIYADDVACAHGNAIGALDEAMLFYARARGIPEAAAKALLVQAHIGEAVARIEHDAAREMVQAWAALRLERLG